jgi:hypothetical protein
MKRRTSTAALIKSARENPFRFFTFEETAAICGWGEKVPGQLAGLGAPIVARKMNPALLMGVDFGELGTDRETERLMTTNSPKFTGDRLRLLGPLITPPGAGDRP